MKRILSELARELKKETINTELVVIGGGMAGICCDITAARSGLKCVLIQDRPVLGGLSISHDEVVHGKGSLLSKMPGGERTIVAEFNFTPVPREDGHNTGLYTYSYLQKWEPAIRSGQG